MKIAVVRGAFLAEYECQIFYPLLGKHEITAFSSHFPFQDKYPFPLVKLFSPMDIPFGPFQRIKMPILNRLFIDAHWLIGLENELRGYDIAHCADTFYNFSHQCVMAKRRGHVKAVVATVFENIPFNNEGIWGRKQFKADVLKWVDHFIAISERSKQALMLEGVDEDKISVIAQHIDTKRFHPGKEKARKDELTILFVGRLEFYKGVYEVLYSAKRLLSDPKLNKYSLRFVFVGNGGEKTKLIDLARRLKILDYLTFESLSYDKMPEVFRRADIFVAPSRATRTYQEQFCASLLEAQASGLPIVTTASGGIPENVENAALVANPGDFYSISEAIKRFIVDPTLRQKYGRMAREHAVSKFDMRIGARKLEDVYNSVLARPQGT